MAIKVKAVERQLKVGKDAGKYLRLQYAAVSPKEHSVRHGTPSDR